MCLKETFFFLFINKTQKLFLHSVSIHFSGLRRFYVYFLRGLGLMPICQPYKSAFFFLLSIRTLELKSRIYLDNTLKIRKPEVGSIFSAGEGGQEGSQQAVARDFVRFLIYAHCAISIFTIRKVPQSVPFYCAIPSSSYNHSRLGTTASVSLICKSKVFGTKKTYVWARANQN